MGKRPSIGVSVQIPERPVFLNHVSKKPKIAEAETLTEGSPIESPVQSEEAFEKELARARNEFQQFNQDLDDISKTVESLVREAPEWFTDIEEIKRKQDAVEDAITVAQEKILESEHRFGQLHILQEEMNEDINNDLKKIQDQLVELLDKHRSARLDATNLCQSQTRSSEQLDVMLQAIHEYAHLLNEASRTIKYYDEIVTSPLGKYEDYERLDLSPFRHSGGSISYFDSHFTTPTGSSPSSPIRSPSPISPLALPISSLALPAPPTPPMSGSEMSELSSPVSPISPISPGTPRQLIYPLPYYLIRHQQLLLLGMRRAAVGLKFLLYAKRLNDLKKGMNLSIDMELFGEDPVMDEEIVLDHDHHTSGDSSSSSSNCSEDENSDCKKTGKVTIKIKKRSLVFHSYELLRPDSRNALRKAL